MRRILIPFVLLVALLVGGCGGSSTSSAGGGGASSTSSAGGGGASSNQASSTSTSSATTSASSCPTSNSRSFAKTRFATDIGGSLFLVHRYVLKPYQAGTFHKGAPGRTKALVKAGLAVATTTKLLSNAQENAKANPTLCRTISGPLASIKDNLGGVVGGLKSGSSAGALTKLNDQLSTLKSRAAGAGIPISEKPVPIGG